MNVTTSFESKSFHNILYLIATYLKTEFWKDLIYLKWRSFVDKMAPIAMQWWVRHMSNKKVKRVFMGIFNAYGLNIYFTLPGFLYLHISLKPN